MSHKYYSFKTYEEGFGHTILTPYPSIEQCVNLLPPPLLFLTEVQIEYNFLNNYPGAFGKMWMGHGYQLAKYCLLLRKRANAMEKEPGFTPYHPCHVKWKITRAYLSSKLQKKDTGLPKWWGDPEIHNSHLTYVSTRDATTIKFPITCYYGRRPYPKY